jgi:ribosomal-protein-serine acetyltransferase
MEILVDTDIVLRDLITSDSKQLFALVDKNREYLRKWLGWLDYTKSVDDATDFITRSEAENEKGEHLSFGIFYQGKVIGVLSFNRIFHSDRRTTIGYWLGQEYNGLGIITKACKSLITYGFEKLLLNKIEINCATKNIKSKGVPDRLGFKHCGVLKENEWLYDHFVDHDVYYLLKKDWSVDLETLLTDF